MSVDASSRAFDRLVGLVCAGDVVVLTGAGISTESGIPDYRGPSGALRSQLPMTIREFTGSAAARQRYWARSHVGWRRIAAASPNRGHRAVAALERAGLISAVITQNVDGLHQAAGSAAVIDLHGNLARVVCLNCGALSSRERLAERLTAANPEAPAAGGAAAPAPAVPSTPAATSRCPTAPSTASCSSAVSAVARTCSSPMSCSSARTSRARASSAASSSSAAPRRCSCSARR